MLCSIYWNKKCYLLNYMRSNIKMLKDWYICYVDFLKLSELWHNPLFEILEMFDVNVQHVGVIVNLLKHTCVQRKRRKIWNVEITACMILQLEFHNVIFSLYTFQSSLVLTIIRHYIVVRKRGILIWALQIGKSI